MKVLMVTMAMDIGGAETHILELSRALARRGVDVTVASNGGAYESGLAEAGIRHVNVPCHTKNPIALLRSRRKLRRLILEEKYDIVHAHARIPAFLCANLKRSLNFRFVTTAHWVFKPGFPYNVLSDWGERSLAVSDDIKAYLVENYGLEPDNILVTINGIDLDKFSPDTDWSGIKEEFSLTDGARRIVYVSRMDTDRSLAAHRLIEIAPTLAAEYPNLEIVIVGGGNDYAAVNAEAEAANRAIGRRTVILTGSRTDINRFAASGEMFIGVSRAALEAMACEKPCIIAGNEGYIGIFDEDRLQLSIDTNFCCRGCEETTAENLLRDVRTILSAAPEERARLGAVSRETIRRHYSVDTMAGDAMKLYISAIKQEATVNVTPDEEDGIERYLRCNPITERRLRSDVMISGYYGFGNMGDDSILDTICQRLRSEAPSVRITALTHDPAVDSKRFGIRCIGRMNIFGILREMRRSRVLISGGGSLFQDSTSFKSLRYYAFIVNTARRLGMKTYVYANGIGTIYSERNRRLTAKTVMRADCVSVRDSESLEELCAIGVPRDTVHLTADPAFLMELPRDCDDICRRYGIVPGMKYFLVSLRRFEGVQRTAYDEDALVDAVCAACSRVAEKRGLVPVFVSMQSELDRAVTERAVTILRERFGIGTMCISPASGPELLSVIHGGEGGGARFVCSMRLHVLIYAACAARPMIGMSLDPKIDAFTTASAGAGSLLKIPEFDADALERAMIEAADSADSGREVLDGTAARGRELASEDISRALGLIY